MVSLTFVVIFCYIYGRYSPQEANNNGTACSPEFPKTEKKTASRGINQRILAAFYFEFLFHLIFLPEFVVVLNGSLFGNPSISRFSPEIFPFPLFEFFIFLLCFCIV